MFRFVKNMVILCFAGSAVTTAIDWLWLHGVGFCFGFLERYAGYWTLVVASIEVFLILIAFYKWTCWNVAHRLLMASSWLLPCYLYVAYLCRGLSADPHQARSFEGYYSWLTATILHNQTIECARALPILSILIALMYCLRLNGGGYSPE